jgi:hypothetical protein
MIWVMDESAIRAIRIWKGVNMIRITDKSFRYTPSFNTDLGKKFRKMEQKRRAAEASGMDSEAAMANCVVPMVARRCAQKS